MKLTAILVAAALLVGAAAASFAHEGQDTRPGATRWDLEVKITSPGEGGVGPAVGADRFGNLFGVAQKDAEPASPDSRSGALFRAASWRWWSADHGKTWADLPGLPASADTAEQGFGADVATDDVGGVYVVEQHAGSLSFLRWKATGLGVLSFAGSATARQLGAGTGRPRMVAHGDGQLLVLWPSAQGTVAMVSTDGGANFALAGSAFTGSCTAATGRGRAGYAIACAQSDVVRVYVASHDSGDFAETAPFPVVGTALVGAPSVAVDKLGRVFVAITHGTGYNQTIQLVHSLDGGRTWSVPRRLDDLHGSFRQVELTAAPDGRLGIAAYFRERDVFGWEIVGSVFNAFKGPGPLLESFARHSRVTDENSAEPPGDRLGAAFDGESRLSILWSANNTKVLPSGANEHVARDVWFVRSQNGYSTGTTFQEERPPVGPLPDCRIGGQVTQVGEWQKIRKPTFRTRSFGGPDQVSTYAVSGLDPARIWATNGTTLMRSEDAGCTWIEIWSLEPTSSNSVSSANARITRIVAPGSRLALHQVWLQIEESVSGGGSRPHVVRSRTGEPDNFVFVDSGLPPAGRPTLLAVSATNIDFGYLAVDDGTGQHAVLYGNVDGSTWTARGSTLEQVQGPPIDVLALDPYVPNSVFEVTAGVLRHSPDGGRSWDDREPSGTQSNEVGPITAVDVFHTAGSAIQVMGFGAPLGTRAHTITSPDGGRSWTVAEADGIEAPVDSLVHGSAPNILVASTAPTDGSESEVYHLHLEDGGWDAITPHGVTAPFKVSADLRYQPTFYGQSPDALWRYSGTKIESGAPAALPVGPAFTAPGRPAPTVALSPGALTVRLGPGQSRSVHLDLAVPPRPRMVDLYFLLDTSSSMKDSIDVLRSSLNRTILTLTGEGVDLRAGLGVYKTENDPPRYRRVLDLQPPGTLAAALAALDVSNGSGNETQLIALDQTLTGSGQAAVTASVGSLCDVAPQTQGCAIPPGQQADFRSGALRIVIHVTDSPFRNPAGTRDDPRTGRPDIAGLGRDYVARSVHVIGIAPTSGNDNEYGSLLADERELSRATQTFAGPGGADCNSDGKPDLPQGAPLVCPSRAAGPVGMVLSLLRAMPALGDVRTTVTDPAGYATGGLGTDRLDLSAPHAIGRDLTVTCPSGSPGTADVTVEGRVDSGPVSRSVITVVCDSLPIIGRQVVPPIVPPILPNPVLPPIPANPPPAAQAQAQAQVQVQSQAQVQAQLGVLGQHERQVQIATQSADRDDESVTQLAMSRRDAQERTARAVLVSALLAAGVAGAVGYRRRTASELVPSDPS